MFNKTVGDKKIWAIAGGKGGVGKSLIAANLGIMLARDGYKVVLIDLDLGGANLHTCIGIDLPKKTLGDFVERRIEDLNDLIVETNIKNLGLISGARDSFWIANIKHAQKQRLMSKLLKLNVDRIILDLGAGTTYNTLDFFINADLGILVMAPEPTSIENLYRFIKSAFYRKLRTYAKTSTVRNLIDNLMDKQFKLGIKTPSDLLKELKNVDPVLGSLIYDKMQLFAPKIITNMVRNTKDIDVGEAVSSLCKNYFGIPAEFLGYVEHDNAVWQSVRSKIPLLINYPNTKLMSNFITLYRKLSETRYEKSL